MTKRSIIRHNRKTQHRAILTLLTCLSRDLHACRNIGQLGHTTISHPHQQFPKDYNLEDVLVAHYCYRNYNESCPTCHTHGILEYSCSFCIENTCEQETCGNKWGWLNNLEECRQTIVITESYETNLERLQHKFNSLITGDIRKFHGDGDQNDIDDGKFPLGSLDYRLFCKHPTAELRTNSLQCYSMCPENYKQYGVSCFSNCKYPQKDEFSTYCIEPEIRKPIEMFSSCAEDCNENNIHDFCFACPDGMKKQDCQCVKKELIEFREISEREHTNAVLLLMDENDDEDADDDDDRL